MVSCLKKISNGYSRIEKIPESLHYLQQALKISLTDESISGDNKSQIILYDQLGHLYGKMYFLTHF